jgi:hypothetical protein
VLPGRSGRARGECRRGARRACGCGTYHITPHKTADPQIGSKQVNGPRANRPAEGAHQCAIAREALTPEIAKYALENITPPRGLLPKVLSVAVAHKTTKLPQWEASVVFSWSINTTKS